MLKWGKKTTQIFQVNRNQKGNQTRRGGREKEKEEEEGEGSGGWVTYHQKKVPNLIKIRK